MNVYTNAMRAKRAEKTLLKYFETADGDAWVGAKDFVADLMHLAYVRGLDFDRLVEVARIDYATERAEEDAAAAQSFNKQDWTPPRVRFKKRPRS